MRTTLATTDDEPQAAHQHNVVVEVMPLLACQTLRPSDGPGGGVVRHGIRLLSLQPGVTAATLEQVNKLRDEAP